MPIAQWIEPDRRRIRAVVSGEFTISDILAAIDSAIQNPAFQPGFDILSDHTEVGDPLTTTQAHGMVSHLEKLANQLVGARWAVVTRKPASYGMMRMVSALLHNVSITVGVFSSFDEAEQWLASPKLDRV